MSTPKFKKEFTLSALINSILYLVVGSLVLIAAWFIWFLYNNFYTTIGRAETVLILKSELAVDVLDVPLYEKIKKESALTVNTSATSSPFTATNNLPNPFLPKQ